MNKKFKDNHRIFKILERVNRGTFKTIFKNTKLRYIKKIYKRKFNIKHNLYEKNNRKSNSI